jgi:transcriptional regulator with XRE-family HTH domain
MEFGERLHELRKQKGMTLEAVGKKLGVSKGYLSVIENGKVRPPKDKILRKLAGLFGVDEAEMLKLAWLKKIPPEVKKALGISD